ncbi:MAG: CoA transferase [Chitinophagaceae bacterium]|nr:CoA transferase [Chitinophagaceae bacterium]
MMQLPLADIIVLEFCQYLSGPCAGLRLADLGARVIKIEHPLTGEGGRKLAIKNMWVDDDNSLLFNTINRNKESFAIDMGNAGDMVWLKKLIGKAHVLVHNFRPGAMERKLLGYEDVVKLNPSIVYAQISGYGEAGPLHKKPGQDLLVQSLSGLTYTTGSASDIPTALGLGIGDYLCGNQAVQFIIAALIKSKKTGKGTLLQLSLLESLIDFQFEFFTTYFQSHKMPQRAGFNNAHALLSAPYGIYKTSDGYIAIAMVPIRQLNKILQSKALEQYDEQDCFRKRDEIKKRIAEKIATNTSQYWLQKSKELDLWVMPVLNWKEMSATAGYKVLDMEQTIKLPGNKAFITTRCPVRINGRILKSGKAAPQVGENNAGIKASLS